ncbi:tRNA (adenosine(37)-N6)-threonylcarbamoyltransferase complex ATPase subunit type 1 TsaE [Myxococcota bacterium]|nr:tRNA (adenosine(37)-N6)-threonylcarbamoyltransferase complex ATPase subunit type 1 TsaE [Myxococcota bacterium]MBU1429938.1 tRNA (adenosine(37)-N6)-threonylcarbamoyltransferase complex ATPase subunit type 1 TsaE [Myxococcota bacterium]MBU1896563.1 tRNA (adenosine(37)-N6)-threonylcarbamoyltransferase complex ATPase subunit type 1 TsaE [Myxococcota bacterium]
MWTVFLADDEATRALGECIGRAARSGDVIAAEGDLGAGKTTLAQGIAWGLGIDEDHYVNSPTFAILQSHPGPITLHHLDLYRISDEDEALGLGLDEIIGVEGLSYVEWPSRLPEIAALADLRLRLTYEGEGRRAELEGRSPRGVLWRTAIERAFINAANEAQAAPPRAR